MKYILLPFCCLFLFSCGQFENKEAKEMLQGVWCNAETNEVSFYANGDTLYFPDSTSVPSYFRIIDDSLELVGANVDRYEIIRQAPHLFVFHNLNGEVVKLKKNNVKMDMNLFSYKSKQQCSGDEYKKDSTFIYKNKKIRFVVRIVPGMEKVLKQTYTNDGIQVDNIFYDNDVFVKIILHDFEGKKTIFDDQIKKLKFAKIVPASFISQSVFSAVRYDKTDSEGIHFNAVLSLPETIANIFYNVDMCIDWKGNLNISNKE